MPEHRCWNTDAGTQKLKHSAETVLEIMLKHGVAVAEIKLLLYMLKHSAGTVAETQLLHMLKHSFTTYAETQFCYIC